MGVTISSGPAQVIASGTVTTFAGQPLVLTLHDPTVVVEMRFRSDPEIPDVAVAIGGVPSAIVLELVNFDRPDGRGTAVPLPVGGDAFITIYLHFRVFLYGRTSDRTVHYTFFAAPASTVVPVPGGG